MPIFRGETVRDSHVRKLHAALSDMLSDLAHKRPHFKWVCVRLHLIALERAYPEIFGTSRTELELAHHFAEEDGDAVPE